MEEDDMRKQIYFSNVDKIKELNEQYERGESTSTAGISHFSDLTLEEFQQICG